MKSTMTTMVLSLTIIAAAMGALLGFVHQVTAEPIAKAQEQKKNEALAAVIPNANNPQFSKPISITLPDDNRPVFLYKATSDGIPCGEAVESWTLDGFSGEITVMVGFNERNEVTGFKVLQSAETPGLGAKAGEWFNSEIGHRSIIGSTTMLSVTKDGGEIDGITAATITSRAFLQAVNRARQAVDMQNGNNVESLPATGASTKKH